MSDDLRQRYAEAIAAKFTSPVYRCDRDGENERVENPEPADRIDQTPYVMETAGDGCRSFWTPSCAELGEVVAAVRDEEMERLRRVVADYDNTILWDTTCREHARLLDECRRQEERAEKAERQREGMVTVPRWAVEALAGPATIQEKGRAEKALKRALAALDDTPETGRG